MYANFYFYFSCNDFVIYLLIQGKQEMIFDLSGKRDQIDMNPMTNSCNTRDTSLTTASAEICLTVV